MKKIAFLSMSVFLLALKTFSQTNPAAQSLPYSQDFTSFTGSTTTYPSGLQGWGFGSTAISTSFNTAAPTADQALAGTTNASTSGFVGDMNGKIGVLATGTNIKAICLSINTSSSTNISVSYLAATQRQQTTDRVGELGMQYRIGTSGTFTNITGSTYQNNVASNNTSGTGSINASTITFTLPAACENQPVVQLRWIQRDVSGSGGRPSFSIDDISISVPGNTVSAAAGINAAEPSTNGSFTINFSVPTTASTDVNYAYTGTATFTTDYSVSYSAGTPSTGTATGTLTVPSGVSSVTVTITPVDDPDVESTEGITLTLSGPTGGYSIGTAAASISLLDNDATPTVSVAAGTNAAEPATNGTFTVTFSQPTTASTTFDYALTGTATFTTDYSVTLSSGTPSPLSAASGTITIPSGVTTVTVTITPVNDVSAEPTETIILTISNPSGGYVTGTTNASINLTDDDITPVSLTGSIYPQDFNTILVNTGTGTAASLLSTGWTFAETGTANNTTYTASAGSTSGDTYSFGTGTNTDRAFGGLQSGSLIPAIGAVFTNNTGSAVTSLRIIYTGEQWRLGTTARTDRLDFQYSLDATSLATGTWTDVDQLDFTSPYTGTVGNLDGNVAPNRTAITFSITGLSIANGASFYIRWTDLNASGADDGLGVDDFSIETNPADPNPPVVTTLNPVNGATNIATSLTAVITFDENIQKGTGNILVKKTSDNSIVQTIDITTAAVTVSGTSASFGISGLSASTGYYIEIANGAIIDLANNVFAGMSGSSTWAFTTGTLLYSANFNTCATGAPGTITDGFTQYSVVGTQIWDCTTFGRSGNGLQINGFNVTNIPNEDWLISPSFDLTATTFPLLNFWSRTRFNGLPLQLKVSTDYVSGNPALATWTDINGKFPAQTTDVWTQSSNINLAAFKTSNVHFAFVYLSSDDDGARWTVDDITLDNSATPPPATVTVSTNDIQFGYAAVASSVTKTFTFTGNDITGSVDLVATANFLLSKDNTTFSSSVSYTQVEANNITKTVYVKYTPTQNDIINYVGTVTISTTGVTDAVVSLKGTSVDPVKTLEVVNWNVEWFGSTSLGPTNDAQQQANVQTILQNIGADLYALTEVVDESRLATVVSNMPGYSYVICNYGSHTNTSGSGPTPLSEAQKEAYVYKTSVFSNIATAPLLSQGINSVADLTNPAYNYFASGRFPFMMTADVTLDGITKTIRFVLLHAKANTSPTATSYARRKAGSDTLYYTFNTAYPTANIVLLGDINDDLDQTITDGIVPPTTSYVAFTSDNTNYYSPTLALSLAGKKSTASYNDMIDHVIVSSEFKPYYMGSSSNVLTDVSSLVTSYASTTSDHYPVFSRYAFDPIILPVRLSVFSAIKQGTTTKVTWTTEQENSSKEFIVERSANGTAWQTIATVAAAGNSNSPLNYSFVDVSPAKGINLYRLKSVDVDNKFDYSATRRVSFDSKFTYSIYPNPAGGTIEIAVDNSAGANADVEIINNLGQVQIRKKMNTGNQPFKIDISVLAPGVYFTKILSSDGSVSMQKFLKQ